MGGVDVGGGGGGKRKSLDSEINMIPMIDLLMVTISFLLITAVWTHMSRINADAQVPGPPRPDVEQEKVEPEKQLHVMMQSEDKFVLVWKQGSTTVDSIDVPRKDVIDPSGQHGRRALPGPGDQDRERVEGQGPALEPDGPEARSGDPAHRQQDRVQFIIGVIDAIYQTHRDINLGPKTEKMPAFNITFAVN